MTTGRFKKIWDRNDLELEETINKAITTCQTQFGEDVGRDIFYAILGGIDAYIEKRKRKDGIGLQPTAETMADGPKTKVD